MVLIDYLTDIHWILIYLLFDSWFGMDTLSVKIIDWFAKHEAE